MSDPRVDTSYISKAGSMVVPVSRAHESHKTGAICGVRRSKELERSETNLYKATASLYIFV